MKFLTAFILAAMVAFPTLANGGGGADRACLSYEDTRQLMRARGHALAFNFTNAASIEVFARFVNEAEPKTNHTFTRVIGIVSPLNPDTMLLAAYDQSGCGWFMQAPIPVIMELYKEAKGRRA